MMMRVRCGFTLVEMLAVLMIMALLAGIVTASLKGSLGSAGMREAVAVLREADDEARGFAIDTGRPSLLRIDPRGGQGRGEMRTFKDEQAREPLGVYVLPSRVKIKRILMPGPTASLPGGPGEIPGGKPTDLRFDRDGVSMTYGWVLEMADQRQVHYVVVGMTGQFVEVHNEKEIQTLLAALPWGDTH